MSDQNPWGTPPPNPGYGPTPGGPPPGAQPPSAPPPYGAPQGPPPGSAPGWGGYGGGVYGSGGGYGGGGYGGGYGGPPPKKKRTGLIVALVVVGVLILAGIVTGVVLAVGGGGDDSNTASDDSSSSAPVSPTSSASTEPTDSPTSDTPTEPTDSPTTSAPPSLPPADADTVKGTGYRYELPSRPGWTKASKQDISSLGVSRLDSGALFGPSLSSATANILVERGPSVFSDVDQLEPTWQNNIETSVKSKGKKFSASPIDGEKADAIRISSDQNGVKIQQVAYLVLHGDYYYSVAVTYQAGDDTTPEKDFDELLASWLWTS